jgi:predicted SAM-dependent methyltransferase
MKRLLRHLSLLPQAAERMKDSWGPKKILQALLPCYVVYPLRHEVKMFGVRWRSRNAYRRYLGKEDLLVNLAAGPRGRDGWVNVDGYPAKNVNLVYDLRKPLPFPDGSVKAIFCEHFFEHLDFDEEVHHFLADCKRILKPGGVMRLIVPDLELYLKAYAEGGWDKLNNIRGLDENGHDKWMKQTYETRMELVNTVFRQKDEHRYGYDHETMEVVLNKAGFSKVLKKAYMESELPNLCLDTEARASESLYYEIVK